MIIGGGVLGQALLELLRGDAHAQVAAICNPDPLDPAVILANTLHIPYFPDYRDLSPLPAVEVVIAMAEDLQMEQDLERLFPSPVRLLVGPQLKALLTHILSLVEAKRLQSYSLEELLFQYGAIYDITLRLAACYDLSRILYYSVENAIRLTKMGAGSIALYDEWNGEMFLGAIRGFSEPFSKAIRWPLRAGGLTSAILNSAEPLVVPDLTQYPKFDNPLMLQEGIRSLMATPLMIDGRIIGVLYVNDFKVRDFTARESSLLLLLGSIAAEMIERAQLLENAMRISITDDLTGLSNHHYFLQRLTTEIKRSEHYQLAFTLVMADIDSFRLYNTLYGHPKGNEVLRQVSALLSDGCRDSDIIARYGGDKFGIVMPGISPDAALKMLDRLLQKVAGYPFEGCEKMPDGKITLSIGVATYPANGQKSEGLIDHAEVARREAKRQGKNRVVISTP